MVVVFPAPTKPVKTVIGMGEEEEITIKRASGRESLWITTTRDGIKVGKSCNQTAPNRRVLDTPCCHWRVNPTCCARR